METRLDYNIAALAEHQTALNGVEPREEIKPLINWKEPYEQENHNPDY